MKFLTIIMIVFLIHISAAVINSLEIFTAYSMQPSQSWFDLVKIDQIEEGNYFESSAVQQTSSNFGFGDFIKGFAIFVSTLAYGLVAIPYTFIQFGMPTSMATLLSVPVYLIYGIGIAQFISNRGTKSMD